MEQCLATIVQSPCLANKSSIVLISEVIIGVGAMRVGMDVTPRHNQHPGATELPHHLLTDEGADIVEQGLDSCIITAGPVQGDVRNHTRFASVTLTPKWRHQIAALCPDVTAGEEEGGGECAWPPKGYQSIAGYLKERNRNQV